MEEKKLFLLDAYALIFRAYYSLGFTRNAAGESVPKALLNSKGFNTTAVRGFTEFLSSILKNEKPTHIAVVFDFKAQTIRAQEHDFYKANRAETPEDIKLSEPYIRDIIKAYGIPILELEGYEADDVIGTLAKEKEKEGYTVFMVTPDKDFAQLVSPNIFMYKPSRAGNGVKILGVPEIQEEWEVENPLQVIDILGMWGDAVDNIPGIPGVGEKTAKKFIKEYGSMEGLYENVDSLKGKMKEKVIENKEQAFISKKLATIILDAPITCSNDDLIISVPDTDKLNEVFNEMEFKTLGKRLLGDAFTAQQTPNNSNSGQLDLFASTQSTDVAPPAKNDKYNKFDKEKVNYTLIESKKDLENFVQLLSKQKSFTFDTETTGLDAMNESILGMSFSFHEKEAYYLSFNDSNRAELLSVLKPIFENEQIEKIAQNIKYDMHILKNYGINVKGKLFDTMLAHYLLEPDAKHNMDDLALDYLKYETIHLEDLIGKKGKNQKQFNEIELTEQTNYAAEDADITQQLFAIFGEKLKQENLQNVFNDIEMPLVPVLTTMERNGVKIDEAFLNTYSKELAEEQLQVQEKIIKEVGFNFNLDSPKQLGEALFDTLKIPYKGSKTKTGQYATGEDKLMNYEKEYPIVHDILEYRQIAKLRSTYVDALPQLIDKKTGRVHTSFNQAIAATGRLSSTNPNLQNIPIRTERGKKVRKAFIPKEGNILLAADYSQIELRLMAELSGDKTMLQAFNDGLDIHAATASKVFNVPLSQVSREMRSNAKTVNFGIIYGVTAFGLSQQTDLSRKESAEIIEAYFKTYPDIKKYMDENIKLAQKNGYVSTIMGRKRKLYDINSKNAIQRSHAERNAINAPVQGSAADMIKIAMINIQKEIEKRKMLSLMTLQVHDELVFDVEQKEAEEIKTIIKDKMETAISGLKVPIIAEIDTGKNWLEAH
ncbi:MAG: DNA polymerase I [Chitinophagales bacterium]|nr:DNA polymerase I [Chitinophagales bacterium]